MDGGQQTRSWLVGHLPDTQPTAGDPYLQRSTQFLGFYDGLNDTEAIEAAAKQPGRYFALEIEPVEVGLRAT